MLNPAQKTPPPTGPDLWDLVERAQAGDVAAFGELYDATVAKVYTYVLFRVGRHRETAEDVTGDTYRRALAGIASVRRKAGSPIAWLYRIAHNLAADHWKHAQTRLTRTVADISETCEQLRADVAEDLAAAATLGYLGGRDLWAAVLRLTEPQRDVIVARFLAGLTVPETAEVIGRTAAAVKVLQYRGVRALRRDKLVQALAPA